MKKSKKNKNKTKKKTPEIYKVMILEPRELEGTEYKEHDGSFDSMADVLLLFFYCCLLAYILHILSYVLGLMK